MDQSRASRVQAALELAFAPASVRVIDRSAQHAGHSGASEAGETHYDVAVVSPTFATMSRVARARAVHEALAGEFGTGLHALSLSLRAPGEAEVSR